MANGCLECVRKDTTLELKERDLAAARRQVEELERRSAELARQVEELEELAARPQGHHTLQELLACPSCGSKVTPQEALELARRFYPALARPFEIPDQALRGRR